ncbi:PTS fructose transporter subunit IIA [Ectothiorhodospiraceae bacterium BW-2]|nr:PTS fructose transporter subunit IIA [Ectothiorhodospiraceae bacterium BW-2]
MSIRLILITHHQIGQQMLQMASDTFGTLPLETEVISVLPHEKVDHLINRVEAVMRNHDPDRDTLIITDIYGATPGNMACRLLHLPHVRIISGLNLPMLLKIYNYPQLSIDDITTQAIKGGQNGILACNPELCELQHG